MRKIVFLAFLVAFFNKVSEAQFSVQNALIEVFTGAWVGYEPDGAVRLESALASNPNAIAVNIHDGDAMEVADGVDIENFYSPAYPQAVINRNGTLYSRGVWSSTLTSTLTGAAYVTITYDSVRFDSLTRQLDVYMKATFTGPVTGDMRFNCIVVEDSVTGTGSGYDQTNYDNTTPGHPYYGAGNPIIGFVHRYVARDYLGGAWGISGSVPSSVNLGSVATYHFTTVLNAAWDEEKISLVGMISRYDGIALADREILNVEKCETILPPNAQITANTNIICKDNEILYSGASTNFGETYFWEFEGGNPATSTLQNPGQILYSVAGNYTTTLSVSGIAGTGTTTKGISIIGVNTQVSQTDSSLIADLSGATYRWFNCSVGYTVIPGATNQELMLSANGDYAVEIVSGACKDTSDCISIVSYSINENLWPGLSVYPNPGIGDFVVDVDQPCQMKITDINGAFIALSTLVAGENKLNLKLASGMYFLTFISTESSKSLKLVVQ